MTASSLKFKKFECQLTFDTWRPGPDIYIENNAPKKVTILFTCAFKLEIFIKRLEICGLHYCMEQLKALKSGQEICFSAKRFWNFRMEVKTETESNHGSIWTAGQIFYSEDKVDNTSIKIRKWSRLGPLTWKPRATRKNMVELCT